MKTYRIWFNDYSHRQFLETSEPLRSLDYRASNAAGAFRQWTNHFYGYMAERIELITDEPATT